MANSPFIGIDTLHKFPTYISQEDYKQKTGLDAPPYNPDLPFKYWEDPAAKTATSRNMTYDVLEMTDTGGYKVEVGAEIGMEVMLVPRIQASQVNVPYAGNAPIDKFGGIPVPMPLNKPATNQKIVLQKFNQPAIRNLEVALPGGSPSGPATTNDLNDRLEYMTELLKAIGAKVGVRVL